MSWPQVPLESLAAPFKGSITDGPFGSNLARQHYRSSGPLVVRLQNIGDGVFVESRAHIDADHFESLRKHEVLPGDLLIASLGEVLPRACIAPRDLGSAIVKADCIRVRLRDDVDQRWVNYSLQRPAARKWAEQHRHGVGRPRLGLRGIRAIPIPLPSLAEQRRIVEILKAHLSRLDSASHELSRASRRLLNLDESVLRALVPDDCPSRPLVDLLDAPLTNGRSVPSREGGFPVLRLTALKDAGVDLSERKAGDWSRAEASRFLVQRGDFLVARGNGSLRLVGRGSLVRAEPDEVAFPDTAIRARPRVSDLLPDFLDVMWNSRRTRSQVEAVARTSAGIYKVNQSQLERIELPSLPISFQLRVVEKMDAIDDSRRRLLDTISLAERRQQSMRRSVLAAAFEGKLTGRHTDTEVIDEAASLEGAPR